MLAAHETDPPMNRFPARVYLPEKQHQKKPFKSFRYFFKSMSAYVSKASATEIFCQS